VAVCSKLLHVLCSINIQIKSQSLTAVVGQVGAGKSSLLSAVLGEMERLNGSVNVQVRVTVADCGIMLSVIITPYLFSLLFGMSKRVCSAYLFVCMSASSGAYSDYK